MEWSVLVVQKIQLETTCIFSCLPFGQDFKDCKDTSTAARASSHVEQVFSVNCTVSSVPAVCLKLEQTGWLHENAWVSWEEKKTGLSLAAQLWAACATRRDKLKCSLACSTRTIKQCQHELCLERVMQLFVATFLSHLQAFWPSCATKMWEACHSLEGWGNTAILSSKEQSQSPSQYVDHWRVYILSSSMDARIWCLWWHISNMKPSQNGNYLSHSKRLTLDIWFDRLWGIMKTAL